MYRPVRIARELVRLLKKNGNIRQIFELGFPNDEKILKDLMNDGFEVFTQMVPSDKRVDTKELLK